LATKSLKIEPDTWSIFSKTCFEIYTIVVSKLDMDPCPAEYVRIRQKWNMMKPKFYMCFNSIHDWHGIPKPLDLDRKSSITFNVAWLQDTKQRDVIFSLESKLGEIFNTLMAYEPKFNQTIIAEGHPYQTDTFKPPDRILKAFLEPASNQKVYHSSNDALLTSQCSGGYNLIDMNSDYKTMFHDNLIKTGKRKLDNIYSNDEEFDDEEEESNEMDIENNSTYTASYVQALQSVQELFRKIAHTRTEAEQLITNSSQLFNTFINKSECFFNIKHHAPVKVYINNIKELISRTETLLDTPTYKQNMQLREALDELKIHRSRLEQASLPNTPTSVYPRRPYFNSLNTPGLLKVWNDVFTYVYKNVKGEQKLIVYKINNWNPVKSMVESPPNSKFKYDRVNKRIKFDYKDDEKEKLIRTIFENELDQLSSNIKNMKMFKTEILEYINEIFKDDSEFHTWFSSDPITKRSEAFTPIVDSTKLGPDNYHPQIVDAIKNLSTKYAQISDMFKPGKDDLVYKFRETESINQLIRIIYSLNRIDIFDKTKIELLGPGIRNAERIEHDSTLIDRSVCTYPHCDTLKCPETAQALVHIPINNKRDRVLAKIYLGLNTKKALGNFSLFNILLLQSTRLVFGWDGKKFDLTKIYSNIEELEKRKKFIEDLKSNQLDIPYSILAEHDETIYDIIVRSNSDISMRDGANVCSLVLGPSGVGKTNSINGDGIDSKGVFEMIGGSNGSNVQVVALPFEKYNIAMPFEESLKESESGKQRIYSYKFNTTDNTVARHAMSNFSFTHAIPIDTYIKSYTSFMREPIEKIRRDTSSSFPTICETRNNKDSSRSTFIQAQKTTVGSEKSYNIILDRPGDEEPYSTFSISKDAIEFVNPIIGLLRSFDTVFNDKFKFFDTMIPCVPFAESTFKDYISKIIEKIERTETTETLNSITYQFFLFDTGIYTKSKRNPYISVDAYLKDWLGVRLSKYANSLESYIKELSINRFSKNLNSLDRFGNDIKNCVIEFIRKIHHNKEWLDHTVEISDFNDLNDRTTNLFINGFAEKSIKISELFPTCYSELFERKVPRFHDVFFKDDDFFTQINSPLLGWPNKMSHTVDSNGAQKLRIHQISGPTGTLEYYDDCLLKLNSFTRDNNYPLENEKFSLSFEPYVRFSKFGNQSYMNTNLSISNFLMATAMYFAVFKNTKLDLFYDEKVEILYSMMNVSKEDFLKYYRKFFEAISINETNKTLHSVFNESESKTSTYQNINLNRILTDAIRFSNDLILPKIDLYPEFDRKYSFSKDVIFDFSICEPSYALNMPFYSRMVATDEFRDAFQKFCHKRKYIMGKKFLRKADLKMVNPIDFEKQDSFFINTEKAIIIVVLNPNVAEDKGKEAYLSLAYNLIKNE
jgi:uncharacterized protein YktA (UPF0223 family)